MATLYNKFGISSERYLFLTDSQYTRRSGGDNSFVRFMSNLTYEQDDALRRTVIGDMFATSGDLGSTINLGGVGISKVYSMDPYFIKYPTPTLTGAVTLPSQVEVYLNGMLMSRQQIQPGTFDLKNFYYYGGAGNVDIIIRDPYGNVQKITQSAYFSTALLREGLHEYSYNAGFLREKFGIESNDYGKFALSAFHRYGVNDALNVGASAEASEGLRNMGLQTSLVIPKSGFVTAGVSGSSDDSKTGSAAFLTHNYQLGGTVNTTIFLKEFSRNYSTLATSQAIEKMKYQRGAGATVSTQVGALSVNYSVEESYSDNLNKVLTASYIKSLSPGSLLNITGTSQQNSQADRHEIFITLSFFTDQKYLHMASYRQSDDSSSERLYTAKNVPTGEGVGYRLSVDRTERDSNVSYTVDPYVQVNARYGTFSLESIITKDEQNTFTINQLNAAGALVYAGGFWGVTRPINDSFTFVSVDSIKDATVKVDNETIGKTDASGMMIVPSLQSYYTHGVTVDTTDLSLDYNIAGSIIKNISLRQWSGACIAFNADKLRAVVGSIVIQDAAKKIPLEFQEFLMQYNGIDVPFHSGRGGEFYLENLLPGDGKGAGESEQSCRTIAERRMTDGNVIRPGMYQASADYKGRKCTFKIIFPETEDVMSDLGEIVCAFPKGEEKETPALPEPGEPPLTLQPAPESRPAAEKHVVAEQEPLPAAVVSLRFDKKGSLVYKKDRLAVGVLVRYLNKHPDLSVNIEVHGDRHGTEEDSKRVGLKQNNAIRKYLISAGVKPERIKKIESLGRSRMLCFEATPACDRANRRGVIRLVRSETAAHSHDTERVEGR